MQNSAIHKLVLFYAKGLMLAVVLVLIIACILVTNQYEIFSFFLVVLIGLSGMISVSLVLDFRRIERFNWNNQEKESELPINLNDDLTIKVCKRYVNHATYEQIKEEFGLSSNEQITRIIRKRLKESM